MTRVWTLCPPRRHMDFCCIYVNTYCIYHLDVFKVCSKTIKTEAVFIKTEINNEWKFDFHKTRSFNVQIICHIEFLFDWITSKTSLRYKTVPLYFLVSFMSTDISLKMKYQFRKYKKSYTKLWQVNREYVCTCTRLCFTKKSFKIY